jgi:hypothetical protein
MDKTCRDVLAIVLERLQQLEKDRNNDLATLMAVVKTVRSLSPDIQDRFKSELARQEAKAADPVRDLDGVYHGLIRLLKGLDPTEEGEEERLRLLLESFEGRPQ